MTAWLTLFQMVAGGKIPIFDAVRLADAIVAGLDKIRHGQDLTPDEVRALVGDAMPVLAAVAKIAFPAASPAVSAGMVILSMSHRRTPEEERRWMDRASGGPGH